MIKRLLFVLVMLCGVHAGKTLAGDYSVGSTWNVSAKSPRPIWGIRGYVILEPYGMYQNNKGIVFHTHTNGSKYGSEVLVEYSQYRAWLKLYRWVPNDKTTLLMWDNTTSGTYPRLGTGTTQSLNQIFIGTVTTGSIASSFLPYTEELSFGTESKRVMYFDNVSIFAPTTVGTTSGWWKEYTRIWNFQTGRMDLKWAFQWNGTLEENYSSDATKGYWAGALETTEYATYGTRSAWVSGTSSAGNYLMDFIGPTGEWRPMDSRVSTLRVLDNPDGGKSGLNVYYPASPSVGHWLAHVP